LNDTIGRHLRSDFKGNVNRHFIAQNGGVKEVGVGAECYSTVSQL
jgi:hypothetical protein